MKLSKKKLIVGLEIGTTKVVVLIGEKYVDGSINVIGIGKCPSQGINKGNINDLFSVVKSIKKAVVSAEKMAKCQISSVYLSLSGKYISCQNEIGMVTLLNNEVTYEDVEKVVYTAKSVRLKHEHRILHVIPQEYNIDHQEGIKNPIGLSGFRIQAKVHLITCHNNIIKNIVKAVELAGIKVNQLVFSGFASSLVVLNKEEIEIGVCLIDIGGGTMDIVIYTGGALRYTKVIPYAGNIVTSDIAYAFSTSFLEAEKIKIQHGFINNCLQQKKNIEIISKDGKNISVLEKQMLFEVIEPRYQELLSLVNHEILHLQKHLKKQGIKYNLSAGIVITGGGSQIRGLLDYAKKIFCNRVRIGMPIDINGLEKLYNPIYSTVIGLLNYEKKSYLNDDYYFFEKKNLINKWFHQITNWFKKEF